MSSAYAPINCLFCFSSVHTYYSQQHNEKYLTPSDIIICCSKHLSEEFFESVKWVNVSSIAESLCQECYNIAEKLNNLNINLNKIFEDINELGSRLNIRISEERRNYELSTQQPRGIITHQNSDINQVFGLSPSTNISTERNDPDLNSEVQKLPTYDQNVKTGAATTDNFDSVNYNFNDSYGSVFEALNSEVDSGDSQEKDPLSPGNAAKVNFKGNPSKSFAQQKEILNTGEAVSQLDEIITSYDELQRHSKEGLEADFKCDKCSKKFSTKRTMKGHYCPKQTYECKVCNISFLTTPALKPHMRTHPGEKPYECEVCQKPFSVPDSLKSHMRSHTGERPYNCTLCNKSFARAKVLQLHMRTHTGVKPYHCEVCNKSFSIGCGLTVHMRSHTGEKPYSCDICNKSYSTGEQLKIHNRTHTGEKPYKCEICGKYFPGRYNLQVHLRTHSDERPFKCKLCKNAFRHKSCLTKHLLTHEETKNYMCDICSKSYKNFKNLKYHLLSHTEIRNFFCKECGKGFKHEEALRVHEKYVHLPTDERPHQCTVCEKSFPTKSRLTSHMRDLDSKRQNLTEPYFDGCPVKSRNLKVEMGFESET